MDKDVVPWYQMQSRSNVFPSCVAFMLVLQLEFGPSPCECPHCDLFKLTQDDSVHDYYASLAFTKLKGAVTQASILVFPNFTLPF